MYKNDRWGHRSFQIFWPEEEIINVSDHDPKDTTLANLNYVEESLKITRSGNTLASNKLSGGMYLSGICAGLCAMAISWFGMENGLFCTQNLCLIGAMGCCLYSAFRNYDYARACNDQNKDIDIELNKVAEARETIAQFKQY